MIRVSRGCSFWVPCNIQMVLGLLLVFLLQERRFEKGCKGLYISPYRSIRCYLQYHLVYIHLLFLVENW